jgi:putative restriction endonuclease
VNAVGDAGNAASPANGTIAPTDFEWYSHLRMRPNLEDVNFWKPSAERAFRGTRYSPFFFKLKAPHRAICGFGFFVRYASLPDWLAWECFGEGNGCGSLAAMQARILKIRDRMNYRPTRGTGEIGCIVVTQPTFFAPGDWIPQPRDWPERSLTPVTRQLQDPEWQRVWHQCQERASAPPVGMVAEPAERYGTPRLVQPRLGQGAFRVLVTEVYGRACAVTEEHSLPVLEAAHIKPFAQSGAHEVSNGILLRADLHRLFDRGYLTVDEHMKLRVGDRLRQDYANGRTYYPLHGRPLRLPEQSGDLPASPLLAWHRENVFLG